MAPPYLPSSWTPTSKFQSYEWRKRLKDPRPTLNSLRGPLYAGEAFFVSGRRAGKAQGGRWLAQSCKGLRRYAPQKGTRQQRTYSRLTERDYGTYNKAYT
jgi:hypothetical protein